MTVRERAVLHVLFAEALAQLAATAAVSCVEGRHRFERLVWKLRIVGPLLARDILHSHACVVRFVWVTALQQDLNASLHNAIRTRIYTGAVCVVYADQSNV